MNELRRQKIMKVMAVVLLAFGGSLVYFLFFNTGLNVVPDPSNPTEKILVVNDSVHAIRHVTLSYRVSNQEVGAQSIDILLPSESRAVELDPHFVENNAYTVHVSAPYHLSRELVVPAGVSSSATPALSATIEVDPVGTQHKPVSVRLSGRSKDSLSHVVSVSLELNDPAWGENPPVQEWGISPDGDSTVSLSFIPLVARQDLSFKIRVFTSSDVLIEHEYTVLVLPGTDSNSLENPVPDMNADANGSDA